MTSQEQVEIKVGIGATKLCWTDREPFTVIEICTAKKLVIQEDKCEPAKWDMDFRSGGFSGTVVNQGDQKWFISDDPTAEKIEIRQHKNGRWYDKHHNQYAVGYRHKFYDYNF